MKNTQEIPWLSNLKKTSSFQTLKKDLEVDVAIVGGGIAGITAAYLLSKSNIKVALFEMDTLVSGETGYTTGFITKVFDTPLQELIHSLGDAKARLLWESSQNMIDFIEKVSIEEKIECEFMRCPAYMYSGNEKGTEWLQKEVSSAQSLGFDDVQFSLDKDLSFSSASYMKVENQAKYHVGKFLLGLAQKAQENGALIFEHTKVDDLSGRTEITLTIGGLKVLAKKVIIATNNPFNSPIDIQERLKPYISYVIELKVPKESIEEALYWDTEDPYHYFRIDRKETHDVVILGGEDHKNGHQPQGDPYKNLEKYFQKLFPTIKYEILNTWSGQILESVDGIPFIGETVFNASQLVSTGFAGNGMTFGPLSAHIHKDIILQNKSGLIPLFTPKRFGGTLEFLKHGIEVGKDAVTGFIKSFKNEDSFNKVQENSGMVITVGGKKMAVYKDEKGNVTKLSPYCTHQKCIVNWNQGDKTWDCPCHGSRFSKSGEVITGPAIRPLENL